jgi:transposase
MTPIMCWSTLRSATSRRFFSRLKQFCRIATRYEKLARNFFGMLSLACVYIWLA